MRERLIERVLSIRRFTQPKRRLFDASALRELFDELLQTRCRVGLSIQLAINVGQSQQGFIRLLAIGLCLQRRLEGLRGLFKL